MKYLIWLCLAVPAAAQSNVQNVHEVALSTSTIIQTVAVTSQTYVDVSAASSSGTLAGRFAIEVYNPSANASAVVCGFDVALSTLVANAWYGREIGAGLGVYWAVPSSRKLYCQTLSTTASTRVTVTQIK